MDLRKICDSHLNKARIGDSLNNLVMVSYIISGYDVYVRDGILCNSEDVPKYQEEIESFAKEKGGELTSFEVEIVEFEALSKKTPPGFVNHKSGIFLTVESAKSRRKKCELDLPFVPSDFEFDYCIRISTGSNRRHVPTKIFYAVKDGKFFCSHTKSQVVKNVGEDVDIYVCASDAYIFLKDLYDLSSAVVSNSNLYEWVYKSGW